MCLECNTSCAALVLIFMRGKSAWGARYEEICPGGNGCALLGNTINGCGHAGEGTTANRHCGRVQLDRLLYRYPRRLGPGQLGSIFNRGSFGTTDRYRIDGWHGGGTVGYNLQFGGGFVAGIEADLSAAKIKGTGRVVSFSTAAHHRPAIQK